LEIAQNKIIRSSNDSGQEDNFYMEGTQESGAYDQEMHEAIVDILTAMKT